jgi:hypothetical protein
MNLDDALAKLQSAVDAISSAKPEERPSQKPSFTPLWRGAWEIPWERKRPDGPVPFLTREDLDDVVAQAAALSNGAAAWASTPISIRGEPFWLTGVSDCCDSDGTLRRTYNLVSGSRSYGITTYEYPWGNGVRYRVRMEGGADRVSVEYTIT